MSAPRSYEISFRAVLDDRQVDELADTLFELGYDGACFRPLAAACSRCGESMGDETSTLNGQPTHIRCPRDFAAYKPPVPAEHYSRADSMADRDALRAADQHDVQRTLK